MGIVGFPPNYLFLIEAKQRGPFCEIEFVNFVTTFCVSLWLCSRCDLYFPSHWSSVKPRQQVSSHLNLFWWGVQLSSLHTAYVLGVPRGLYELGFLRAPILLCSGLCGNATNDRSHPKGFMYPPVPGRVCSFCCDIFILAERLLLNTGGCAEHHGADIHSGGP